MNGFYVFRRVVLHSPDKLLAENGRNINRNIYFKLLLLQKINVNLMSFNYLLISSCKTYSLVRMELSGTRLITKLDHRYTEQQAL